MNKTSSKLREWKFNDEIDDSWTGYLWKKQVYGSVNERKSGPVNDGG